MSFKPTIEQEIIFNEITETDNNIIINAVAGAGKSSTLVYALKLIPKNKSIIFLAFNKAITLELKDRVPFYIDVSTIHSFGAKALFKHFGSTFSENKVFTICLKLFKQWQIAGEVAGRTKYEYCYVINKMVDLMRLTLTTEEEGLQTLSDEYGFFLSEMEITHVKKVFKIVSQDAKYIDFVDMVYQPAVKDIKLPRYDYVFVDESQDLSAAQQAIIKKIIMPGRGRLICVGDPRQSIYGFAGSDHESYERMKTLRPNTVELSLSYTFRCPKVVVKRAQEIVPQISCSETQIDGIDREDGQLSEINAGDWVLCRNVYPLVLTFRYLLNQGKKAHIKGREIGKNIINLIEKTKKRDIVGCLQVIEVYIIQLKGKLFKKGYAQPHAHPKMQHLVEKREIIKILSKDITSTEQLKKRIETIFMDTNTKDIVLSTIHKSKGLENDRIFFLCPDLIPSKYASTPKELLQEKNLMYVGITRSKNELIFINETIEKLEELAQFNQN